MNRRIGEQCTSQPISCIDSTTSGSSIFFDKTKRLKSVIMRWNLFLGQSARERNGSCLRKDWERTIDAGNEANLIKNAKNPGGNGFLRISVSD